MGDENKKPSLKKNEVENEKKERKLGKIQTKPPTFQFGTIETKLPSFSSLFGEVKTIPNWIKKKEKSISPEPSKESDDIEWIRIIPRSGDKYTIEKLPSKLASIGGRVYFRFFKEDNGSICIFAGHESADAIKKALLQRLPNTDLQTSTSPPSYDEAVLYRKNDVGESLNKKGNLKDILNSLEPNTYLNIAFEEGSEEKFKQALRKRGKNVRGEDKEEKAQNTNTMSFSEAWSQILGLNNKKGGSVSKQKPEKNVKKELNAEEREQARRIDGWLNDSTNYFDVTLSIGAKKENHVRPIFVEVNTQLKEQDSFVLEKDKSKQNSIWREEELEQLINLPDMTDPIMQRNIPHLKQGEQTLDDDQMVEGVAVGRLIHPTKPKRLVCIPVNQFLRHFFMGGKNGSGKSSTAIQMIQSLLDEYGENPDKAPGFTYIDPAGSTLNIILNRLLHMESKGIKIPWNKIHYIDLTPESQYPVGLNLLYHNDDEDPISVAGNALDVIKSAYPGDAGFTERIMENGLATLVYDKKRKHTILGLMSILQYPDLRSDINLTDPLVQEFWETTGDSLGPKQLDPLLNRLRPLLQNPAMRRIFGQSDWMLNIRQWMDEGHIILVNVLNLEPKNMGLVGGQFALRYHVTAKTRPADISKPHMLMIDEAHNVKIPIINKIIAEDRKFGLSLGLITQFPEQFDGDISKSITENMGTFMTCTVGPDSARVMNKMMNGAFENSTLQGLPTSRVAAYTTIKGEPFSFMVKSDPPVIYLPNGKQATYGNDDEMGEAQQWAIDKAKELSSRDGKDRDTIDAEISEYMQWLRSFKPVEEDEELPPPPKEDKKSGSKLLSDELKILEAVVAMVGDKTIVEDYTSGILNGLKEYLPDEMASTINDKKLGKVLGKSDWLEEHGIESFKRAKSGGSFWSLKNK